jgi:alkylation response protein AidB-like acyl-CoA dehydrogenase
MTETCSSRSVDFALSEEQALLRDGIRRFLGAASPPAAVRRRVQEGAPADRELLRRMGAELGILGIGIPEDHEGIGLGLVELAVTMEEMGRALSGDPFFASHVLGGRAILHCAEPEGRRELLGSMASGEETCVLACFEGGRTSTLETIATTARRAPNGKLVVSGEKIVIDGDAADQFVVVARSERGLGLFFVPGAYAQRTAIPTMDPTRRLTRVTFEGAECDTMGSPGADDEAGLRRALDEAAICLSAELLGVAERALEESVAYAKVRKQFGRPIGSFQAVQHSLADVLVAVESARSAVWWAAWSVDQGGDHAEAASIAKSVASEAASLATSTAIQVHGGIGFTWDHDAHLWFKRARASSALLGDAASHRERIATRILDDTVEG